jgi:diguanylate cyclase (GGDEF)-like protein
MRFPIPLNEAERLQSLHDSGLLEFDKEQAFEALVRLMIDTFGVPIGAVTLIAEDRQVFKAISGLPVRDIPRSSGFCSYTICETEPLVIRDTLADPRFRDHPLVTGAPWLRFYAGASIAIADGLNIGTICVMGPEPRNWSVVEQQQLLDFARLASSLCARSNRVAGGRLVARLNANRHLMFKQRQRLMRQSRMFDYAFDVAQIGTFEFDLQSRHLVWSTGMYRVHDVDPQEAVSFSMAWSAFVPEDRNKLSELAAASIADGDPITFVGRIVTPKGNQKWVRLVAMIEQKGGKPIRVYGLKQDVTAYRELLDSQTRLAERDDLTGLFNRRELRRRLDALAVSARSSSALFVLDLDGFKEINDGLGHAAGDHCLRIVAQRLAGAIADRGFIARMGGDEFAILVECCDKAEADRLLRDIQAAIRPDIVWEGRTCRVGCSIGVSVRDPADCQGAEMLREADVALYESKASGKNCHRYFSASIAAKVQARASLLDEVRLALQESRPQLYYQPKIGLQDGSIKGFEALLRMRRNTGEIVTPAVFGDVLQDARLSAEIGEFVVETAVRQAAEWSEKRLPFHSIAINVADTQLRDLQFADRLRALLAIHSVPAHAIEMEITESIVLSSVEDTLSVCRELKKLGVSIAFDDFGTGFASLSHLREYPVDVIKIDRSFVADLGRHAQNPAIVASIVGLGTALSMSVVAEGVETWEQATLLASLGCQIGQGYLFGRPEAAPAAEAFLLRHLNELDTAGTIARVA